MTSDQEFFTAIKAGNQDEVQRLLEVEPALVKAQDEHGLSAVLLAAYQQKPDIAWLLAQHSTELNIFEACAAGDVARVETLIKQEPELVNAFAPDGFQPLGLAAFFGHQAIVEFLLTKGAEVNAPSHNAMQVMPLHSAIANGHTEIAQLLLENGSVVNATQADDFTPLHEAAQNGLLPVAQALIERGAKIDARLASNGKTPLALAIEHGHADVVNLLRQRGAVE